MSLNPLCTLLPMTALLWAPLSHASTIPDDLSEGETLEVCAHINQTGVKRHKVDREIDLKSSHRQIRERAILKKRFLATGCRIIDVKSSHLAGRLTPSMTTF
jgi:hypothetical protein